MEMATPTLAFAGFMSLVACGAFFAVGRTLRRTLDASGEGAGAARAFVLWWICLGTYVGVEGALTLLTSVGAAPFEAWLAERYVTGPLLAVALWGLSYYVAYLYSGSTRLKLPLAALFAIAAIGYDWAIFDGRPYALRDAPWLVELAYAGGRDSLLYRAVLTTYALPPLVASVLYLTLLPRVTNRHQRYRIILVSTSIILWIGSGLVIRLGTSDLLKFVNLTVFGLGAAIAILLAYHPPRFLRARLHLPPLPQEERVAEEREARRAALHARVRDLV